MKYIKKFESFSEDPIKDIKIKLGNWLYANIPNKFNGPETWSGVNKLYSVDYSYQGRYWRKSGLSIKYRPGRDFSYDPLKIQIDGLKDNKQKELEIPTKLKIILEYRDDDRYNDDIVDIFYFLSDTLKSYSYFSKEIQKFYPKFFIKISDFDEIFKILDGGLDLYKNRKKFNL